VASELQYQGNVVVVLVTTHHSLGPKCCAHRKMRAGRTPLRAERFEVMRKVLHLYPYCLLREEICR
jgi:hypothetical protein